MSTNGVSKHNYTAVQPPIAIPMQQQTIKQIPVTNGVSPWSETVLVTPEIAESWLKANVRNRQVRKSRVRTYARDMSRGGWLFNTQGITFATDGTLIDGQHRLMAVVESGASVLMVVWFNVPATTRSVIDLVGARSLADVAEMTKVQAAVTIAMMRGLGTRGKDTTMAERSSFFKLFATEINATIGRFTRFRRGITQDNVLAAIARASLHMGADDIDQFCDVLQNGVASADPRDVTVIRLRDKLLSSSHPGGTQASKEVYALTVAALRAFWENKAHSKLYPTSVDPFSLPDRGDD